MAASSNGIEEGLPRALLQRLDEIRNNPAEFLSETDSAKKATAIIQKTNDQITFTKIQELAASLKKSTSAIERRYSLLLIAGLESYKKSTQQIKQVLGKLNDVINHAQAWLFSENPSPTQLTPQIIQEAIDEYRRLSSSLPTSFPNDDEYTSLQEQNKSLVEKLEQSFETLQTSQDDWVQFIYTAMEILKIVQNMIAVLSREMELMREHQIMSAEPIRNHVLFLQDVIKEPLVGKNPLQSMKKRIKVLRQEEPEFAEAYKAIKLAFTDLSIPRQNVVDMAQELRSKVCDKAKIIVQRMCTSFETINDESSVAALDKLTKAIRCSNPSCLGYQEQKAAFASGPLPIVLQKCSRCMQARYCSKECQKKHWPEHKKICLPPQK